MLVALNCLKFVIFFALSKWTLFLSPPLEKYMVLGLSFFTFKSSLKNSYFPILSFTLTSHNPFKRCFIPPLIYNFYGILNGILLIFLIKSFSVFDSHGVEPVSNSNSKIPTEKISLFTEYKLLNKD